MNDLADIVIVAKRKLGVKAKFVFLCTFFQHNI